jgi:23S rRNA pseudouridine1911/1915/1917 synthase
MADAMATAETTTAPLVEIQEDEAGRRLDTVLAERLADLSRSRLQALLRDGHLKLGDAVVTEGKRRVKPGERYSLTVPPAEPSELLPEDRPLDIVYEDEDLLVLDKPAGLVVHPAAGHTQGTLVHALLAHCGKSLSGIGGVARPGIVHRIDKDVSGLLVIAKHDRVHQGLAGQFTVHSVERLYEALVYGVPSPTEGVIDQPLGRHPTDRKRMAIVQGGKRAVTRYRLLEAAGTLVSRLELALETGRTHQIRVHLTSLGHPLLGDRIYKPRKKPALPQALADAIAGLDRVALHAKVLGFTHPRTGERLRFESAPPAIFGRLLDLAHVG